MLLGAPHPALVAEQPCNARKGTCRLYRGYSSRPSDCSAAAAQKAVAPSTLEGYSCGCAVAAVSRLHSIQQHLPAHAATPQGCSRRGQQTISSHAALALRSECSAPDAEGGTAEARVALSWAQPVGAACGTANLHYGHSAAAVSLSASPTDAATEGIGLWATDDGGNIRVEAHAVNAEQINSQQQHQQQYHRHRPRHMSGHAVQQAQQQLRDEGQLLHHSWQPVLHPVEYVQLLQQAALVQSWSGALRLLQQKHHLRQAHIGLLWWQLKSRLQARLKAAAAAAAAVAATGDSSSDGRRRQLPASCGSTTNSRVIGLPQQRVHQVLHQLVELTVQHVSSLSPQSLAYTLQGLASAVAAGEAALGQLDLQQSQHAAGRCSNDSSTAAPVLSLDLVQQLWTRLREVADRCTPQQLARCLTGGKLLGWQLSSHGGRSSGSSNTVSLCCWPIVEAACSSSIMQGLCAAQPRQKQRHRPFCCSSSEASELLAALAVLMSAEQDLQAEQQLQQQQPAACVGAGWRLQHPNVHEAVANMLTLACRASVATTAAPAGVMTLGQGVRYTYEPSRGTASTAPSEVAPSLHSSHKAVQQLHAATTAVSILHSAAVLGVQPDPWQLEQLVERIEPHLGCMAPQQLLQALQALLQLHVEPWDTWLTACYSRLQASMHQLDHHQLLQLLLVLPLVRTVQPSQLLLHRLAKLTAVHCSRYSWDQLVVLPGAFVALGYQPPPYWLKDYASATRVYLQGQSEQQQRVQQQQQLPTQQVEQQSQRQQQQDAAAKLQQCVDMLAGVSRLGPSSPPTYWLSAMENEIIARCELQRTVGSTHDHPTGVIMTARMLDAFAHLNYQPKQELLQLLGVDVRTTTGSSTCAPVQVDCATQLGEQSQISSTMTAPDQHTSCRVDRCSSGDSSAESSLNSDCLTDHLANNSLHHHHRHHHHQQQQQQQHHHHHHQQQQQEDEIVADVSLSTWQLDLSCRLSEQLCRSQLGGARHGMQFLIKKGWQMQRVCTTRGSSRLADWGVSLTQEGPVLALL